MDFRTVSLKHIPPLETHQLWEEIHCIPFSNKEVLIVIDDFTRPNNPIARMVVEYAISEVGEDKVAVVVANGLHRASSQKEIEGKIGSDLTKRLRLYQHSPLCNFPLKKDKYNVIAVGCVIPHTHTGLSGDAKIFMPGLSYYEDVVNFHLAKGKEKSDIICSYREYADTYVNYTINSYGDPTNIVVYSSRYTAAEFRANAHADYTVILPDQTDVAILAPWFKNHDFIQSMNALQVCMEHRIVKENGILCIKSDTPEGMGVHYGFQQPNGWTPAYYDLLFNKQLEKLQLCFICPNIPEKAIQEYFFRRIFNFATADDFARFVEGRFGRTASVVYYRASDIMIGERE